MSDQVLVGTRKGCSASSGRRGITPHRLPRRAGHGGARRPARRRALRRRSTTGTSASSSTAPTTAARRGRSSPRPRTRRSRRRGRHRPDAQQPLEWTTKLLWSLEAGHADEPGALWCGTIPGGLFRSDDRGESWQLVASLWDQPGAQGVVRRRLRRPRHPLDLRRSARRAARRRRRLVRRRVAHRRRRRDVGRSADGMRADVHAARARPSTRRSRIRTASSQCPPRPTCCGRSTTTASSARPTAVARGPTIAKRRPSTFGFAVAVHPRDPDTAWFVPAESDELRVPVDGRSSSRARATAARPSRCSRTACRRSTPTISSTATPSTSPPTAIGCCSARRPARCGGAPVLRSRRSGDVRARHVRAAADPGAADRLSPAQTVSVDRYDLVIFGAGSGNSIITPALRRLVDRDRRGGTVRRHVHEPRLHPDEDARPHRGPSRRSPTRSASASTRRSTACAGRTSATASFGPDRSDRRRRRGVPPRAGSPNVTCYAGTGRFIGERQLEVATPDGCRRSRAGRSSSPPAPDR